MTATSVYIVNGYDCRCGNLQSFAFTTREKAKETFIDWLDDYGVDTNDEDWEIDMDNLSADCGNIYFRVDKFPIVD